MKRSILTWKRNNPNINRWMDVLMAAPAPSSLLSDEDEKRNFVDATIVDCLVEIGFDREHAEKRMNDEPWPDSLPLS